MNMPSWLTKRLDSLNADQKRKLLIGCVAGGFLTLISIAVVVTDDTGTKKTKVKEEGVGNLLMGTEGRALGLSGVSNEVAELRKQLEELKDQQRRDRLAKNRDPGLPTSPEDPDEALDRLAGEVAAERGVIGPPGTIFSDPRPTPPQGTRPANPGPNAADNLPRLPNAISPNAPPAPPAAAPVINSSKNEAPTVSDVKRRLRSVYIPTGSIMTGTLLTGLDAPTGRQAQGQPIPVVIRVKQDAILPSRYRSDVKEAFVLAAGFGDLSSERAYLRAERFSMILRNGEVIDIPIKMSAVGNDGKSGLRGRLVSKQGAVIGKALLAGTADGVSRAFGGRSSGSRFGGDLPNGGEVAVAGLGGGASTALDRIAAYFLDQAEAMYPVIEIDAGREVSLLLLEGTDLAPRAVDEDGSGKSSTSGRVAQK